MKRIEAVILGYGDRSDKYAEYSLINPTEMSIIAVIDIEKYKLQKAKEKFDLPNEALFESLEAFLAKKIKCDVVINGTMDNLHFETSMKLLKNGYNILLEKPITPNKKQLLAIRNAAKKYGCKVVVCHVLRYTPFYSKIKEIINSGEIGKIVDMQLNEHVWYGHFVNAFVRGKWNNEKKCGSGLLLQKCCHDTDLMCWLNNRTEPIYVSSFGQRAFFNEDNAPKGATEYCYNCPNQDNCMFDAYKFELKMDAIPVYIWADLKKPIEEITDEEKIEYLKSNEYGKCVYKSSMDIVDRQCVSVSFKNGSIGTLTVVGGTSKPGRNIHIICEYGEIQGSVEENKIIYRKFNKNATSEKYKKDEDYYTDVEITPTIDVENKGNSVSGHYGGDYYIMKDLVRYLSGEKTSLSTTVIDDSVNSHLVCYGAEKSRIKRKVVKIKG